MLMFFEIFAVVLGIMAALAGHQFGLEMASDWLYCWHLDYMKKLKPITDAYSQFNQQHPETKEGV
jgi:hypothetical protein